MTATVWDQQNVNREFRVRATNARNYLQECRTRVATIPRYQILIDEHTAIWEVNDYFVDRSFTASRDETLAELRSIRNRDRLPLGIYDSERYRGYWKATIDSLIARFEI